MHIYNNIQHIYIIMIDSQTMTTLIKDTFTQFNKL